MSLYMVWKLFLSTDLVEYNLISQFVKFIIYSCVLLILINILLAPGWAAIVVPNVCFGGIIISGLLFFTNLEKQRQNMFPILIFSIMCIVIAIAGIFIWKSLYNWALVVMGASAVALLIAFAIILGNNFIRELKCRFHTR